MVSQGRVGALVGARPEERRAVLEEAAGITGLHARRHEAEMKLRAAEANLQRAEDARGGLEVQLASLKRQARQAARYRDLSSAVREAEAELLSIQRARAERERDAAQIASRDAEAAVGAALDQAKRTVAHAAMTADALPPLRDSEAAARTIMERHRLARERFVEDEARARTALEEARRRFAQLNTDLGHSGQIQRDAMEAESRLAAEDEILARAGISHPDLTAAAETEVIAATGCLAIAEAAANQAIEAAADANAQARVAERAVGDAEQRAKRLNDQRVRAREERAALAARQVDPGVLADADVELSAARGELVEASAALVRVERQSATHREVLDRLVRSECRRAEEAGGVHALRFACETASRKT